MDGVSASLERCANNARNIQVTACGGCGPYVDRFVGKANDCRIGIGSGVHRYRSDSQLAACARNTKGNFAPVSDQDLFEHLDSDTQALPASDPLSSGSRYSSGC